MGTHEKEQLCWGCANAIPSADGKRGCSWSRDFIPVDGWVAEETSLWHNKGKGQKSYNITSCPQYTPDLEEEINPKMMEDEVARKLCIAIVKEAVNDWKKLCEGKTAPKSGCNFLELRWFFKERCGAVGGKILERLEQYRIECEEKRNSECAETQRNTCRNAQNGI